MALTVAPYVYTTKIETHTEPLESELWEKAEKRVE